MISSAWRTAIPLVTTLMSTSCDRPHAPPDRSGFYNLFLTSTHRDYAAERYYTCEVGFELDVRVPLPDTFETVADASIRRSVVWNAGGQVAEDLLIRRIPIRLDRLRRAEWTSTPLDSVQITLGGLLADTVHGIGLGGPEGRYDGDWSCPALVPPAISSELREKGYPAGELQPGQWHIYPVYGGD